MSVRMIEKEGESVLVVLISSKFSADRGSLDIISRMFFESSFKLLGVFQLNLIDFFNLRRL